MKEKDFIKLSLLDKTIDHDKIKNNILSNADLSIQTLAMYPTRKQHFKSWAVTSCLLLLMVSLVGGTLMLNYKNDPVLPSTSIEEKDSVNYEQSTEAISVDVSSDKTLGFKIVYGEDRNSGQITSNIYYGYGTLRIDYTLEEAMNAPENADALFNVGAFYLNELLTNDPDDVEYMQAKENYSYWQRIKNEKQTEYDNYRATTDYDLNLLLKEQSISEDLLLQFYAEFKAEIAQSLEMPADREKVNFRNDAEYRLIIKRINTIQMDDQTQNEIIDQLDKLRTEAKTAIDEYYAAKEKYEQLRLDKNSVLIEAFFERNGLHYSEILKQYGKLLLTKEEILSLAVNNQEKLELRLMPETSVTGEEELIIQPANG